MTTIGRNVLWALILVAALVWGINSGDWRHFITLAILFGISKSLLLWGNLKLRRETARLKGMLEEQGRPTFVPEPEVLDAMQKKADAIVNEINRLCPPRQCLRFCINYNRKPTVLDTKLGGTPYWDSAMPFPTDAKGKEMALVLQVNFEQCPHLEPLPQEGMLQYFISIDDEILESAWCTIAGWTDILTRSGWRNILELRQRNMRRLPLSMPWMSDRGSRVSTRPAMGSRPLPKRPSITSTARRWKPVM